MNSVVPKSLSVLASVAAHLVLVAPASANEANPARSFERSLSFMRVFGPAHPPYGFVQFCDEKPEECRQGPPEESRFVATPERLSELDDVNRYINRKIQPVTDLELYGVAEYWTLPVDKGDCEDYALLKRHILIERGWPISSLLMTVVRDEKGEGHAVLTARTAQGDFVLDNKVDDVKIWSKTPYEFVMRQSYLNPRAWISLDPSDGSAPMAISGVKNGR